MIWTNTFWLWQKELMESSLGILWVVKSSLTSMNQLKLQNGHKIYNFWHLVISIKNTLPIHLIQISPNYCTEFIDRVWSSIYLRSCKGMIFIQVFTVSRYNVRTTYIFNVYTIYMLDVYCFQIECLYNVYARCLLCPDIMIVQWIYSNSYCFQI